MALPDSTTLTIPSKAAPDSGNFSLNREDAFLVYATFCGDLARTAHALGVSTVTILRMADEENWNTRLAPILELKKGCRPGDIERAMNRALSFVQAHRMKTFLDRVMNRLTALGEAELDDYLMPATTSKAGVTVKKLTTRPLADLASALEKAHSMAYHALNDTAQERVCRKEANVSADDGVLDLHAKLSDAMAEVSKSRTPRALLFDAQLHTAEELRPVMVDAPPHPNDDDDH